MGRQRKVSDEVVFETVQGLLAARGEKAVTFSAVAEGCGLAASSLAERYGTILALIADSREAAWQRLDAVTDEAAATAGRDSKGAVQLLKALNAAELPVATAQVERAAAWRGRVETELALRLGGGSKGREAAAVLFAVWHSQQSWPRPAEERLRMKTVLKRLGMS